MPFPFMPWSKWNNFLDQLRAKGITVNVEGDPVTTLENPTTGDYYVVAIESLEDSISPSVMRSTCKALGLDASEFGFDLPAWYESEEGDLDDDE
jgi:hypothetical protein